MIDVLKILQDYWQLLLVGQYPQGNLGGLALTLILSAASILLAFPFGVILAVMRVCPIKILRIPAIVLIYLGRGVPLIMFIFWVYFFIPLLIGTNVSGFTTILITMVIYQGAYLAEIVRSGIEGLPSGQMEASRALGMSYMKTMIKVILPQAIYNMLPTMVSQFVSTIKETSLASIISVQELTFSATQINNILLTKPMPTFFILAMMYFILCFALTCFARYLERRIATKRAGIPDRVMQPAATITSA